MPLELYSLRSCPHCADLRDELEFQGQPFVEYDVEADAEARRRLAGFVGESAMVPVLVEDGRVKAVGYGGRGCYVRPI